MKQINEKKLLFLIVVISILVAIPIYIILVDEEIETSYRIPIYNEENEHIGLLEIYEPPFEGNPRRAEHYRLKDIVLCLDNRDNSAQFSSHFRLNSTKSDFSIEFFDNGDNKIGPEDRFIFYNYTEYPWVRIVHLLSDELVETKLLM
jgi:hypothetical protein